MTERDVKDLVDWLDQAEEETKATIAEHERIDPFYDGVLSTIQTVREYIKKMRKVNEAEGEMKNKYSKKQLEELYNCEIFKDTGFDSCTKFWVAQGLPFTEDGEDILFTYADGWDLNELHENIREEIRKKLEAVEYYE